MPKFLQNTVNIRDLIMICTIFGAFAVQYATNGQRLKGLEEEFDRRAEQGDKALDLLHDIHVRLESHVARHDGLKK